MTTPYEVFEDCKVTDVNSVTEFLDRYYRKDRYTGRGEEYAAVVLASHKKMFELWGMDWIARHESVTGGVVAFYGKEGE